MYDALLSAAIGILSTALYQEKDHAHWISGIPRGMRFSGNTLFK